MDRYKETYSTWNKLAKLYQDKFMDLDLYNDTYDKFCEEINMDNASILDVGCGPGNITKYLLNKRAGFRIKGIDTSPNMIELAKAKNSSADFAVMDCRNIDKLQTKFDGIVCGFCLPYLSEPDSSKLIKECSKLLNPKGVLYLSFVEGDHAQSGFQAGSSGDRTYFYFHTLKILAKQLSNNHLETILSVNKRYTNRHLIEEVHTIVIARK